MLSEQWKAIPMRRRGVYLALGGGVFALAALHASLYVLLGKTGLFDVVENFWGKDIVINGFPFAMLLLSVILAALVALGTLGAVLWRQTRSLPLVVAVITLVLAVYLAGLGITPDYLAYSIEQTAEWYRKLM